MADRMPQVAPTHDWLDDSPHARHERAVARIYWVMEREAPNLLPGSFARDGCEATVVLLRQQLPRGPRPL